MAMTAYSWDSSTVASLLTREANGLVDMWDNAPPGHKATAQALANLRKLNEKAMMEGLALVEQQAMVMTGHLAGLRPEIFEALGDLPGVDVLKATALAFYDGGQFDFGSLSEESQKLATDILARIGDRLGAPFAFAEYLEGTGQVVAFVYKWAGVIIDHIKASRAEQDAYLDEAIECVPPGYSAAMDSAAVQYALRGVMKTGDWTRLFVPETRPIDPDWVHPSESIGRENMADPDFWEGASAEIGFTCCVSTFDHGRVIAPLGAGVGNSVQSMYGPPPPESAAKDNTIYYAGDDAGLGLLPMCPDVPVHRAQIVPGGHNQDQYDSGDGLPMLAGLGAHAWRLLWASNPIAFAVDGDFIADCWVEYLALMIDWIARNRGLTRSINPVGDWVPVQSVTGVCDDWAAAGRYAALDRFFKRLGATTESPEWDGIGVPQRTAPVVQWRKYAEYQATLVERPVINYVDARTCAPTWRKRVGAAQRDWLERPAEDLCRIITQAIPNPEFAAAVTDRKRTKGGKCFDAGKDSLSAIGRLGPKNGPSLETSGGPQLTPIPSIPPLQMTLKPPRAIEDDESGGALFLALVGVAGLGGFGWWLARRNAKGRRR